MSLSPPHRLYFEIILGLLVIFTIFAIAGERQILERRLVIDSNSGMALNLYDDRENGGQSSIYLDDEKNMQWHCILRDGFAYPLCGFEVLFDKERTRGVDLRHYEKIRLRLDYQGPSQTVRISLRNFDPRYSKKEILQSTKYNQIEFNVGLLNGVAEFSLKDFFVANWWVLENKIPPQLSHPQFDNITIFEVQSGSGKPLGKHQFQLHKVEFIGQALSTADWYLAIMVVWLGIILSFLGYRIIKLKDEVVIQRKRESELLDINALLDTRSKALEIQAKTDPLTGAFNRLGLEEAISLGLQEWHKYRKPLSLVMIDIDHFKQVNDQHGHDIGDLVLSHLSTIVQQHTRSQDLFARWGGEEFVLVCRDTDIERAYAIAEKLRELIASQTLAKNIHITASFGIATLKPHGNIEQLFKAADTALYDAKSSGRNRVVIAA
ncbi:GGDEF domain-containing protein [Cellvibrio sp. OA-2007]|uniref:GGDEF domain-containing protein n=1 Tax=Cellvibrio sp. OA-2007 TaxID=529823 RepID=UPI00078663C1|nr:GGDEF domain-containing protein [Cellvibrio sp. OA-2007]